TLSFNDPAATEIYTLSLHDALPIFFVMNRRCAVGDMEPILTAHVREPNSFTLDFYLRHGGYEALKTALGRKPDEIIELVKASGRSEEHTSELQSRGHLVCRLLLEKK